MKPILLSVLVFFISLNGSLAQRKLSNSRQAGYYTYIYQLTDKESFLIASDGNKVITDGFLHTLVDSFYHVKSNLYKKKLPYGNYLQVKAVKNELEYKLVPENNVNLQFINNHSDFQFTVNDLKGNLIPDARVTVGKGKTIKYHEQAKLYVARSGAKKRVITVAYNGVNNYFTYEEQEKYKPYRVGNGPSFFKKIFGPKSVNNRPVNKQKSKYTGYMVFNKPMYKPLDTVKFKAYLLSIKGKALKNKPLNVVLQKDGNDQGMVLATLSPYREGGYEYSFVLADSLQLKLDRSYSIVLKEQGKKGWAEVYRRSFRYEDYELKSVNFAVRTDKEEHSPGSPVSLFLKATDENELAVPDGRVEVLVQANNASKFYDQQVFVKDTLWKTSLNLDPVGETKLVLPDSIFPKADLDFSVNFTFLNSNNESRTAYRALKYSTKDQALVSEFKKDSLHFSYRIHGAPVKQKAVILVSYPHSEVQDSLQVELPAAIKMNYRASNYHVKMADGYKDWVFVADLKPEISVAAVQSKDSLRVQVSNVHQVPFWYTIFSGNKILFRGYTSTLDTLIKHGTANAAHVKLNYVWDEAEQSAEASAVYAAHILNVKLLAPDVVYPGQRVNMQVKVTDVNARPVAGTDVTAYAYTAKFKNAFQVGLPGFGKRFPMRKLRPKIEGDDLSISGKMKLSWDKWAKELNLDTIAYYQFTQAKELYVTTENGDGSDTAIVSPFIIKNGAIVPVHAIYIDEVPVYFSQAEQLKRYAFRISPGKHNLRMRTSDLTLSLDDYDFVAGKKTILSITADVKNTKARVNVSPNTLTTEESFILNQYLIRIEDNFRGAKTTLNIDSASFLLNFSEPITGIDPREQLYNGNLRRLEADRSLLVGPFEANLLNFKSADINLNFVNEPGYTYTFLPGLLKQKSYPSPYVFNTTLTGANAFEDYKQLPFKQGEIDSIWNDYLDLRSRTTNLFQNTGGYGKAYGRLQMNLDTAVSKQLPYLKNIIIYKYDEPGFLQIYPGNASYFNALEQSKYRIMYLFKDNRYFVAEDVRIQAGGVNYFDWKGVKINPADALSKQIDQQIKTVNNGRKGATSLNVQEKILQDMNDKYLNPAILTGKMTGRVIDAHSKVPIAGVMVKIKGANYSTHTGSDGRFTIKIPLRGKLIISFIGFDSKEVELVNANAGDIQLEAGSAALEEVVVVGYGTTKRKNMTAAMQHTVGDALSGRLSGVVAAAPAAMLNEQIVIRGFSTSSTDKKPLVIVDGLPYSGDVNALDANTIASMDVVKGEDAAAIYGARAAGGVIIIKTKGGSAQTNLAGELQQQESNIRKDFSDYAIWQPKLLTDAGGMASFTVKFPDDITNWTTKLLAINGRKQGGLAETSIKSFKTLSANLVSPLFALAGDSIKAIGKLMNYNLTEETVSRKFSYNGVALLNSNVRFKNAKIDTLAIVARGTDSLSFEYTMKQDNGYFDGESRKIPLLPVGVTETKGFFNALTRDTTITYNFDARLGKVTLRAEASLFPTLLDEIDKLRQYEYLCNEQMASKLKALLLEKVVRKYLAEDFKEEKNIKFLVQKLQNNQLPEGTWGWWQNSNEELWISLHVVESLLEAQKQGYKVQLDKDKLYRYLVGKMANSPHFDQVYGVKLLNLLNEKHYLNDWINSIEKQRKEQEAQNARERKANAAVPVLAKQPLYEKLQLMQLKQKAGMPVDIKWLLSLKNETMFGNSYWGEAVTRFWDNSIQNTLLAYQILKTDGGYRDELDRIQRYFLEQRKDGQWRNTYESSLILQTILPELMGTAGKKPSPASITLNKTESITAFPMTKTLSPSALTLEKKGDAPVYFTAYQQFNNPDPEKVSKDFTVSSSFEQNQQTVQKLKAGTLTTLKVVVDVRADADYVMIEIPIPAGCSYENKMQRFWGVETHREYFKHKTSIFCTQLKKGKYTFNIELMPRYSGNYTLNPAKAEMMYFPVFYGREGIRRVAIN